MYIKANQFHNASATFNKNKFEDKYKEMIEKKKKRDQDVATKAHEDAFNYKPNINKKSSKIANNSKLKAKEKKQ